MNRVNTNDVYVWNFGDSFLVECSRCRECAKVVAESIDDTPDVRLLCHACGYSKKWEQKSSGVMYCRDHHRFEKGTVGIGAAVDWYFHQPLWLKASCCGEVLWAYNREHLAWLKDFVGSTLRERKHSEEHGWSNRSLASRLPRWIQDSSNRAKILKTIAKLESKCS